MCQPPIVSYRETQGTRNLVLETDHIDKTFKKAPETFFRSVRNPDTPRAE